MKQVDLEQYRSGTSELILNGVDLAYADISNSNLRSANLYGANLEYANLEYANLEYALLEKANLNRINLNSANLGYADLKQANLSSASLKHANLTGADLYQVNLEYADLKYANLNDANLYKANLKNADLTGANLNNANLKFADLTGAFLRHANLENIKINSSTRGYFMYCPTEGSYIGWKQCDDNVIVKLLILEDSLRSSATTNKCRASKVQVLSIVDSKGNNLDKAVSSYDESFVYRVKDIIEVENFEYDRWNECAAGIHHFLTKEEAELWFI